MTILSHYITELQEQIQPMVDAGEAEKALSILNQALKDKADDTHFRASILELRGTLYYQFDHIEYAMQDFNIALTAMAEGPDDHELNGSLHASLGAAHHALDDIPNTIKHWHQAIKHYQANEPPLLIDTATISNNLGFLHKQAGDMDHAENGFLRALQILHGELGKYDAFTATVFCNLGGLYQQTGFLDQAKKMHETALTIRSKMLGNAHPDTAQSHNNMALTLMAIGQYDEARSHIEMALKSFGALGPDYDEDFQLARANYIDLLHEVGEYELADELEAKYT